MTFSLHWGGVPTLQTLSSNLEFKNKFYFNHKIHKRFL